MDEGDEELRAWVRHVFGDPAPRDVVPGDGLTVQALDRMNAAVGKAGTGTVPGQVVCDPDGLPIGVGPSRTVTGEIGPAVVSSTDLDRLGLSIDQAEARWPGLVFIEAPPNRREAP